MSASCRNTGCKTFMPLFKSFIKFVQKLWEIYGKNKYITFFLNTVYYTIPAPYQNQLECTAAPPESYKANNSKNTTETIKYSRQAESQHADNYTQTHYITQQRHGARGRLGCRYYKLDFWLQSLTDAVTGFTSENSVHYVSTSAALGTSYQPAARRRHP